MPEEYRAVSHTVASNPRKPVFGTPMKRSREMISSLRMSEESSRNFRARVRRMHRYISGRRQQPSEVNENPTSN